MRVGRLLGRRARRSRTGRSVGVLNDGSTRIKGTGSGGLSGRGSERRDRDERDRATRFDGTRSRQSWSGRGNLAASSSQVLGRRTLASRPSRPRAGPPRGSGRVGRDRNRTGRMITAAGELDRRRQMIRRDPDKPSGTAFASAERRDKIETVRFPGEYRPCRRTLRPRRRPAPWS
jgi:hypothetical protein